MDRSVRRLLLVGIAAGLLVALAACSSVEAPATAIAPQITNGAPDGDDHPYVGIMVAQDAAGNPLWRCSGTLMSETLFLTAGHCTEAPAAHVEIWFYDNEQDILDHDYPVGPGQAGGTPYTHPNYDPNAFFLYDLGVVVLEEAYPMSEYGALPTLGTIDALATRRGRQDTSITAVGYGLQRVNPVFVESHLDRLKAVLEFVNSRGVAGVPDGTSIFVSGNAHTGGTCFGDSGGPMFLNDSNTVVAVTSFGLNGNCAGVGGGYRVDTQDDLDWLGTFFD